MSEQDMSERVYVLGRSEEETNRLQTQARLLEPFTRRFFEQMGIRSGMKILDVGSGAGDVTLLLAEMVGPTGIVVSVDQNPNVLETARTRVRQAGFSNVTFFVTDIKTMQFGPEFDAVVGRFILGYIRPLVSVPGMLARYLRPGGIMGFQEFDLSCISIGSSYPASPLWDQTAFWILEVFRRLEAPVHAGFYLNEAFMHAGLPPLQITCEGLIGAGPDWDGYVYLAETLRSVYPHLLKLGIATAEEVALDTLAERLRTEALSQRATSRALDIVSVWTRKPYEQA